MSKALAALAVFGAAAALTITGAGTAAAATPHPGTCSGGNVASGTYTTLTITGDCRVPDGGRVVVEQNLVIAPGARFDAQTHSRVIVHGDVAAGAGSAFALGCTPAHPCDGDNSESTSTSDVVDGNVVLNDVFDAALNGDVIRGSLVVNGGGPGYSLDPWIPFSIKDDVIKGNVSITGLRTSWWGLIRSHVGGSVVLTDIQGADPDSNEVVANVIGGNLVCYGNSPAPHLGDAVEGAPPGYGSNTVAGRGVGQCTAIPAG